jgi:hypothetical protein
MSKRHMEKHAQSYTGIVLHHAQVRDMIKEDSF